jgi:hypothetical protein
MDRRTLLLDQQETLQLALDSAQANMWTCLPAIVTSVNLSAQTIECQPALKSEVSFYNKKEVVNFPILLDVPIMFSRGGGFAITHPVSVGDECLVVFASRCIDAWWETGEALIPTEIRFHDLSDGFAFFAPTSQPKKLANVQTNALELRTIDRNFYLNLNSSGVITIKASQVDIQAPITTNSTINASGNITGAGVSLNTHTHSGVTPGGSNTGGPT